MKRRGFLSMLVAAALTPPEWVSGVIETQLPKLKHPVLKMVAYEEIGITICNTKALQKLSFNVEAVMAPNKPRDILHS